MKQWFVVHTQSCKENLAVQQLSQQGFEVYLPQFKKTRRHARKVHEVLAPLFPRYLFIGVDLETDRWRSINGTKGVAYILMNGDLPAVVPTDVIDNLKAQETNEGILPIGSLSLFSKGDMVRILEGAFKEYTAIFERLNDNQRVQLLLNFLGRTMKIVLPIYTIEAA